MKKLILILLALVGTGFTASAQLENTTITLPLDNGPVLVGGAMPVYAQVVYEEPVAYNAPVQYYAPVVYNAPVFYNTGPAVVQPVVCQPVCCADNSGSTVQIIAFGRAQARQQGYQFAARR
jgi:hypothetical protein